MKKFVKKLNQFRTFYLGVFNMSFILSLFLYKCIYGNEILSYSHQRLIFLILSTVLLFFIAVEKKG